MRSGGISLGKNLFFGILIFSTLAFFCPPGGFGESEGPHDSFGFVESLSGNKMTLREFDYLEGREVMKDYSVTPETRFDFAGSSRRLEPGDDVNVAYREEGDQRVAETVALVEASESDPAQGFFDLEALYLSQEES